MAPTIEIGEALSMFESGGNGGIRSSTERCGAQRHRGMSARIAVGRRGRWMAIGQRGGIRGVAGHLHGGIHRAARSSCRSPGTAAMPSQGHPAAIRDRAGLGLWMVFSGGGRHGRAGYKDII